ncbi:MAG: hypothetical protein ACR2MA_04205 [Egibacteraceae bacterium]
MRWAVEAWAPEYGAPASELDLEQSDATVDAGVELASEQWRPLRSDAAPAPVVQFVDGVRRIDATLWITGADGQPRPGIAASYAAGIVRCDGAATVEDCQVRRTVFSSAPELTDVTTRHGVWRATEVASDGIDQAVLKLQEEMGALEQLMAVRAPAADLLVTDGPLRKLVTAAHAIGAIKSHRRTYLPPELAGVVAALRPAERTPLFRTLKPWSRYSWYLRLPTSAGPPGHPWSGVIRAEASGELSLSRALELAELASATLPRFASASHKDPRAPQNLYPIAGLERRLRHQLGDARLALRALQEASARQVAPEAV